MKKYYGNYLGICINSQDPESRGRVQIFIPHIMPALYEGWNESGEDITIECVGNNLPNGLSSDVINKLVQMLPWAEAASPVIGSSVAGAYNPSTGNFNQTSTPEGTEIPLNLDTGSSDFSNLDLNDNLTKYAASIGARETGFDAKEANSDYYNAVSTVKGKSYRNSNVARGVQREGLTLAQSQAKYGDYGFFQTNQNDVEDAVRRGIPRDVASAMNNGGGRGNYSVAQQTNAIAQYIKKYKPEAAAAAGRGDWGTANSLLNGKWPSLPGGQSHRPGNDAKANAFLTGSQKLDINNPASVPTTPPAQAHPFNEPEPQGFVGREPSQSALTDVNASAPVSVGGNNNYENYFNSAAFKDALRARGNSGAFQTENGSWKSGKGTTLCAAGAMITVGTITGSSSITKGSIGSATNLARSSSNVLTNAADSQGNKLYGKQTFPSNYTPQNGDVVAMAGGGKGYGHAIAYLNGKWYAHKAGDNPPEVYLKGGKYNSPALYRLTDAGIAAADAAGVADGSKILPATPGAFDESEINGRDPQLSGIVKNPTSSITTDMDMTGVPQGMFAYPAPGALLWVFFREGNPLFPVYFAASYGATEWQNAQKASSPPLYGPQVGQQSEFNNQSMYRPNNAGAIVFTDSATTEKNNRTVRVAHANSGYFELHPTGTTHYSPNEHIQQVAGTNYNYCLNREEWTQGTDNRVTIGNQWVVIGNPSQANFETIEALTEKVKQVNAKMLQK
jgi:hypothetical protein